MSSKTKIVVLHTKELIYTGLFALLAILFIVLLLIMFIPGKEDSESANATTYIPGVYTTTLTLNNSAVEIEVTVDENNINSIEMNYLDEAVTTMYPLLTPSFDELANQICETQNLNAVHFSDETKYTSTVLYNAICETLNRATVSGNTVDEHTADKEIH